MTTIFIGRSSISLSTTFIAFDARRMPETRPEVLAATSNCHSIYREYLSNSGNTVRLTERQPDGQWLTNVHMFSVQE
jgi:hypothetical protein